MINPIDNHYEQGLTRRTIASTNLRRSHIQRVKNVRLIGGCMNAREAV